jgi:hypothetical protein
MFITGARGTDHPSFSNFLFPCNMPFQDQNFNLKIEGKNGMLGQHL